MSEAGIDFRLSETGALSQLVRRIGFERFGALADYVQRLPYERIDGNSPSAVLEQQRGTCSSKHALLATIALEAHQVDVELMLGIFEMNDRNTPGVGAVLGRRGLTFVPEAHCYLRVHGRRFDFTGLPSGSASPFDSLLTEERIDPETAISTKSLRHRAFIRQWSQQRGLDPETVWQVREECIEELARQAVVAGIMRS